MALTQSDKSNLRLRIVSAIVLIPFTLFVVYSGGWIYSAFIVAGWAICLYEWTLLSLKTQNRILLIAGGLVYISAAAVAFYSLRFWSFEAAVLMYILAWSSDIAGYFVGKTIGGAKLLPSISPKKTWAGFIGALAAPMVIMMMVPIFGLIAHNEPIPYDLMLFLTLAFVGVVFGIVCQFGDLMISALKRLATTKDSSQLIPGHGGLLDRIDSLLALSMVMMMAFYWMLGNASP